VIRVRCILLHVSLLACFCLMAGSSLEDAQVGAVAKTRNNVASSSARCARITLPKQKEIADYLNSAAITKPKKKTFFNCCADKIKSGFKKIKTRWSNMSRRGKLGAIFLGVVFGASVALLLSAGVLAASLIGGCGCALLIPMGLVGYAVMLPIVTFPLNVFAYNCFKNAWRCASHEGAGLMAETIS